MADTLQPVARQEDAPTPGFKQQNIAQFERCRKLPAEVDKTGRKSPYLPARKRVKKSVSPKCKAEAAPPKSPGTRKKKSKKSLEREIVLSPAAILNDGSNTRLPMASLMLCRARSVMCRLQCALSLRVS